MKNIKELKHLLQKILRIIIIRKIKLKELQININDIDLSCAETITTPETQNLPIYSYLSKKGINAAVFSTPNIYTANLYKVIYYARYNTIFTQNRELIVDSVMDHVKKEKYNLKLLYLSKPNKISGVCTVFRSIFSANNYYHTLIDHIPRLYLIDQPEYKDIKEIKLLIPGELTKVEKYFLEKFMIKNIKLEQLEEEQIYLIERLILPSFITRRNSGYLPANYLKYFRNKVVPKRPRNKTNRIYISRKLTNIGGMRCILNEEELMEKLHHYGFKKYKLEDMSIEEQIELFYDASCVIAPHGAGLTNIIFADRINVLEMFPGSGILPHYYYLSKSLGQSYRYWCGNDSNKDANFRVDINQILEILKEMLDASSEG